jgi:hypothetical protein
VDLRIRNLYSNLNIPFDNTANTNSTAFNNKDIEVMTTRTTNNTTTDNDDGSIEEVYCNPSIAKYTGMTSNNNNNGNTNRSNINNSNYNNDTNDPLSKTNKDNIDNINLASLPAPLHNPIKALSTKILNLTTLIESKQISYNRMNNDIEYLPKSYRLKTRLMTKKELNDDPEFLKLRQEMESNLKEFQLNMKNITLRNIENEVNYFKN